MKIDKDGKIEDPFLRGFEWGFQHFRNYQIQASRYVNDNVMDLKKIFRADRNDYQKLSETEFGAGIVAALRSAWGK